MVAIEILAVTDMDLADKIVLMGTDNSPVVVAGKDPTIVIVRREK